MTHEALIDSQLERLVDRILGKVPSGAAAEDIEAVVNSPEARTPHGWFSAWMARAGRVRQLARDTLERGEMHGAARFYLRASEYYRAAASVYWPARGDAAIADALRLHSECFRASLDLDGPDYRHISHADAGFAATGYLARPRRMAGCAALLICCGPADTTAEEQYLLVGRDAIERGWGIALVDPASVEMVSSNSDNTSHLVERMTAAFTEFTGVEPTYRVVSGLDEGADADEALMCVMGAQENSWKNPRAPESERHRHRIRAPEALP